jgi:mannose-6-phosphate isomerase-like protein (cupin superfamily)
MTTTQPSNHSAAQPPTTPDWQPVRPQLTRGVFGKTIFDGDVKVVLSRVEPGGKFAVHRDDYAHVFYFLSGVGTVTVADSRFDAPRPSRACYRW